MSDMPRLFVPSKRKSLADRRDKQMKSVMFKTLNNLAPEYVSDKFVSVKTIHRQSSGSSTQPVYSTAENCDPSKRVFVMGAQ